MMQLTDSFVIGDTVIEVALANITSADTEAIVNSVCDQLHFGSGVSGAVRKAAGLEVYDEARRDRDHRGLVAGQVAVSSGGASVYRLIIHALSSRCPHGTTPTILEACVGGALDTAREKGLRSVAFPALGTGEMGFDVQRAAKILIESAIRDCHRKGGLDRVVFCLLRPDAFTSFFREAVRQTIRQEEEELDPTQDPLERPGPDGADTQEASFLHQLKHCEPGMEGWSEYERVSTGLFTLLFVPPLSEPRIQTRTESGLNVRDAVFPNYAEGGVWSMIDQRYQARYIVFECKNLSKPIGQEPVNQVSRYLRNKALGNVGVISSRMKASPEAREAQKEVFRDLNHLVLLLEDFDFTQMIRLKRKTSSADRYIQNIIADFSLSY